MKTTQQQWDEACAVACPYCWVAAGRRCVIRGWGKAPSAAPHKARARLALAVRAHSDPLLDETWPHHGACLLCGVPGLGARHRRIDSVAGWISADPDVTDEDMAAEFGVSIEAVGVVRGWMVRWPGAWL